MPLGGNPTGMQRKAGVSAGERPRVLLLELAVGCRPGHLLGVRWPGRHALRAKVSTSEGPEDC